MPIIFFIELLLLFFLSRQLTSEMSLLFHRIFRSQKITIFLIAAIFLTGTIIHELSHAIMAKLLNVYVGKMELLPVVTGNSLKLGSVQVGRVDIVRNFFIGIAPFIVGTSLLLITLFYAFNNLAIGFNIFTFLILLFAFVISNTMYSSKKDMEGAVEFFLLVVAPILFLYFIGVRIPGLNWSLVDNSSMHDFFKMASIFLAVPIVLDISIILFGRIVNKR